MNSRLIFKTIVRSYSKKPKSRLILNNELTVDPANPPSRKTFNTPEPFPIPLRPKPPNNYPSPKYSSALSHEQMAYNAWKRGF